ncbi:MAG: aldehyde dehydrogenase family protein, partial [Actinobacteria bacterium]|nr:aldehyde dehydrogenase family protein [Actinomycetota bacterium]
MTSEPPEGSHTLRSSALRNCSTTRCCSRPRAVAAATHAFPTWSKTSASERCRLMVRIADLIAAHQQLLAEAEAEDNGKPVSLAGRMDIPRAEDNMRFFGTAILHWSSEAHLMEDRAINYTNRKPIGVVGCISPWNLPLYL